MPEIDWDEIAKNAQKTTDEHFKVQIASLTSLTDRQVTDLINDTGISKRDLVEVLKHVEDATKSNEEKARAIKGINKGVNVLVSVAAKFLV